MKKEKNIMSYTAKELQEIHAKGKSKTDWNKINNITDSQLEEAIKSDPSSDIVNSKNWFVGMPPEKEKISINIDKEVLQWFRNKGRGYQTYINNILRSYVSMQEKY